MGERRLTEADIERIAKSWHDAESDNHTLPWGKQPGRVRAQKRRSVRSVLFALECAGFDVAHSLSFAGDRS